MNFEDEVVKLFLKRKGNYGKVNLVYIPHKYMKRTPINRWYTASGCLNAYILSMYQFSLFSIFL